MRIDFRSDVIYEKLLCIFKQSFFCGVIRLLIVDRIDCDSNFESRKRVFFSLPLWRSENLLHLLYFCLAFDDFNNNLIWNSFVSFCSIIMLLFYHFDIFFSIFFCEWRDEEKNCRWRKYQHLPIFIGISGKPHIIIFVCSSCFPIKKRILCVEGHEVQKLNGKYTTTTSKL